MYVGEGVGPIFLELNIPGTSTTTLILLPAGGKTADIILVLASCCSLGHGELIHTSNAKPRKVQLIGLYSM